MLQDFVLCWMNVHATALNMTQPFHFLLYYNSHFPHQGFKCRFLQFEHAMLTYAGSLIPSTGLKLSFSPHTHTQLQWISLFQNNVHSQSTLALPNDFRLVGLYTSAECPGQNGWQSRSPHRISNQFSCTITGRLDWPSRPLPTPNLILVPRTC